MHSAVEKYATNSRKMRNTTNKIVSQVKGKNQSLAITTTTIQKAESESNPQIYHAGICTIDNMKRATNTHTHTHTHTFAHANRLYTDPVNK